MISHAFPKSMGCQRLKKPCGFDTELSAVLKEMWCVQLALMFEQGGVHLPEPFLSASRSAVSAADSACGCRCPNGKWRYTKRIRFPSRRWSSSTIGYAWPQCGHS
jgi:hypothetical protein